MDPTDGSDRIRVACRIRPAGELNSVKCVIVDTNSNSITVTTRPEPQSFGFDFVGGEESTQEDFFQAVGLPITEACIQGYNGTILCYGQTGSGKTHTLFGSGISEGVNRGLVPRVLEFLWQNIVRESHRTSGTLSFSCKCSFYEIYQEKVFDLLDIAGAAQSSGLNVREDSKTGVFIEGLCEEDVSSSEDASRVLARGYGNRRVGETAMNRESSRSHAVFLLKIARYEDNADTGVRSCRSAKFSLVDLAGSERQRDTSTTGERLKEAGGINKSLSALGNVINSLASNVLNGSTQRKHIQYRDSKLTFLLRDSFGGNSKTLLIATVSPGESSMAETLSTLKFAKRAKLIKTSALINEESSGTSNGLQKEITTLRAKIADMELRLSDRSSSSASDCLRRSLGRISSSGISKSEVDSNLSLLPNPTCLVDSLERCRAAEAASERAQRKAHQLTKQLEQSERYQGELKMKLKMREAEIARHKKKVDSGSDPEAPSTDVDELIRLETKTVRQELQCEILRLKNAFDESEGKLKALSSRDCWNQEKEIRFNHELVDTLDALRQTYLVLEMKFDGLRNDKFEETFGFPYSRVGELLSREEECVSLCLQLGQEKTMTLSIVAEARAASARASTAEKQLTELKAEMERKFETERVINQKYAISIEELQRELIEKEVLVNNLQTDMSQASKSVQEEFRQKEMENRIKFNEAKRENMILAQKASELEFAVEKSEEYSLEREGQLERANLSLQHLTDKLSLFEVESSERMKALQNELQLTRVQLSASQETSNALQLSLVDISNQVTVYENEKRQLETFNSQLQLDLEQTQTELERAVEDADNLHMQTTTLLSREQELVANYEAASSTIQILEAAVTDLKAKSCRDDDARYNEAIILLEGERATLGEVKQQLAFLSASSHSIVEEHSQLLEQNRFNADTIVSLQIAIQELRCQVKSKDSSLEDLQCNLEDRMNEIIGLVSANDTLKDELSIAREEKSTLVGSTLRSDREKVANLEAVNQRLSSELSQLSLKLATDDVELHDLQQALSLEQERAIALQTELSLARAENASQAGHQNNKQKIQQHMSLKKQIEDQAYQLREKDERIVFLTNQSKEYERKLVSVKKDALLLSGGAAGLKKHVTASRGRESAMLDIAPAQATVPRTGDEQDGLQKVSFENV